MVYISVHLDCFVLYTNMEDMFFALNYLYIYTWKGNCQSKIEAKNDGHGAFLHVSFRPISGHPGCQSQMVSPILIGHWPRRGLKLTSRRPLCRTRSASLFRPMIDGSWPSRYCIYIYIYIYIVQWSFVTVVHWCTFV